MTPEDCELAARQERIQDDERDPIHVDVRIVYADGQTLTNSIEGLNGSVSFFRSWWHWADADSITFTRRPYDSP